MGDSVILTCSPVNASSEVTNSRLGYFAKSLSANAVSYTHLTLPTIYSV